MLVGRIAHRANNLGQVGDHAVILVSAIVVIERISEGVTIRIVLLHSASSTLNDVDRDVAIGVIGGGKRVVCITLQLLTVGDDVTALDNAILKSDNIERVVHRIASLTTDLQGVLQSVKVSELDFAGNAVNIALDDPRTVGEGVSALLTVEVEQAGDLGGRGGSDNVDVIGNVVAVQINIVNFALGIVVDVGSR